MPLEDPFRRPLFEDETEAVKWYRKAAEEGNADAQAALGNCYLDGTGVEKEETKAVRLFRKAAEQGHPEAQYQIGECYYEGFNDWGVEVDESEAVKWYLKAAEQGHVAAHRKLCDYGWLNPEAKIWRRRSFAKCCSMDIK